MQVKVIFQTGDAPEYSFDVPHGTTIKSLFEEGRPLHGQGNPESYIFNVRGKGVVSSAYVINEDCLISVTPEKMEGSS